MEEIEGRVWALEYAVGHALAGLARASGMGAERLAALLEKEALTPIIGDTPEADRNAILVQALFARWAATAAMVHTR